MTAARQNTGGDRPRAEAKRPPGGAVGRCRCGRTGGGDAPAVRARFEPGEDSRRTAVPDLIRDLSHTFSQEVPDQVRDGVGAI